MPRYLQKNIVSASKVVSEANFELSEVEFGLINSSNAYNRWTKRYMIASGSNALNSTDILVINNINHRNRPKCVTDICFTLNIEDTHQFSYALRKLARHEIIYGKRTGKEMFYSVTTKGKKSCEKYREVREQCLVEALKDMGLSLAEL